MHYLGSYRSGAGLMSEHFPNMERSMHGNHNFEGVGLDAWEAHFTKCLYATKGEIPRPKMFGNLPCLDGDLWPPGGKFQLYLHQCKKPVDMQERWVCVFPDLKFRAVLVANLRDPTDKEYDRFFRKLYENKMVRIKLRENKEGYGYRVVVIEKTEDKKLKKKC